MEYVTIISFESLNLHQISNIGLLKIYIFTNIYKI